MKISIPFFGKNKGKSKDSKPKASKPKSVNKNAWKQTSTEKARHKNSSQKNGSQKKKTKGKGKKSKNSKTSKTNAQTTSRGVTIVSVNKDISSNPVAGPVFQNMSNQWKQSSQNNSNKKGKNNNNNTNADKKGSGGFLSGLKNLFTSGKNDGGNSSQTMVTATQRTNANRSGSAISSIKNNDVNGFRSVVNNLTKEHRQLLNEWANAGQLRGIIGEALSKKVNSNFERTAINSTKETGATIYKAISELPLSKTGTYIRRSDYTQVSSVFDSKGTSTISKKVKNVGTSKYIKSPISEPIIFKGKAEVSDIGKSIVKPNSESISNKVGSIDALEGKNAGRDVQFGKNKTVGENGEVLHTDGLVQNRGVIEEQLTQTPSNKAVSLTGSASVQNMNSFTVAHEFHLNNGLGKTAESTPNKSDLQFKKTNEFLKGNDNYEKALSFAKKHVDSAVEYYGKSKEYDPLKQFQLQIKDDELLIIDALLHDSGQEASYMRVLRSIYVYNGLSVDDYNLYENRFYITNLDIKRMEQNPVFTEAVLRKMSESGNDTLVERTKQVRTVLDSYKYFKFVTSNLMKDFSESQIKLSTSDLN